MDKDKQTPEEPEILKRIVIVYGCAMYMEDAERLFGEKLNLETGSEDERKLWTIQPKY